MWSLSGNLLRTLCAKRLEGADHLVQQSVQGAGELGHDIREVGHHQRDHQEERDPEAELLADEIAEALAGDRAADRAELIAYHFTQALVHARAARESDLAELEGLTRPALVLAGDSTIGLDVAKAEAYYRQALELCPPGTPGRPRILAKAGRAA